MALRFLTLVALIVGVVLPVAAQAQQTRVWVDCRHGESFGCPYEAELSEFETAMFDAGATEVVISTELPSDISNGTFRLLVMILPTMELDTPELNIFLPGFLSAGGRLVLIADNNTVPFENAHITEILASIPGHDLVLGDDNVNSGCDQSTNLIQGDPLTAGLATWHFNQVNTVTGGDPLIRFARSDGAGEAVMAAVSRLPTGGEVVLVGDSEGFVMNCATVDPVAYDWWVDHRPFWMNLFSDGSSAPDVDGDGFDSTEDCDDTDPFVFPGADEVCNNNVDDDCDDLVDLQDDDCDGFGDDDDATTADDDDDTGSVFDDDDTPFDGGDDSWNGGCCGATVARSAPSGAAAVAGLLMIGAALRRRRLR